MEMPNFSYRDMAINSTVDPAKALQTTHQQSPFKIGDSQL